MHYKMKNFVLHLKITMLLNSKYVFAQSVIITSDQSAREGDVGVVIPCDYSQFTDTPDTINWNEVNEAGIIIEFFVNDIVPVSGRYILRSVSGNADLIITDPVRSDSQRRFQCQIRSTEGNIGISYPSLLTVYYLDEPVIKGPQSTIYEADPVTLTCIIPDGRPFPVVTWYKDGNALSRKDVTTNDTMSMLRIKQSTLYDKGTYSCRAESDQFKGKDGKSSHTYTLQLYYIRVKFVDEDNCLACAARGYPKPSKLMIMKDGEQIENGEETGLVEIFQSYLTCSTENEEFSQTLKKELKECLINNPVSSNSQTCISLNIVVISSSSGFLFGLVPACLLCCFRLQKRKDMEIQLQSTKRNSEYQELQLPTGPIYQELNKPDAGNTERKIDQIIFSGQHQNISDRAIYINSS